MSLDAIDRLDEDLAAIRAVAALLGAADGVSDEVRAEACALIVRLSIAASSSERASTQPVRCE